MHVLHADTAIETFLETLDVAALQGDDYLHKPCLTLEVVYTQWWHGTWCTLQCPVIAFFLEEMSRSKREASICLLSPEQY